MTSALAVDLLPAPGAAIGMIGIACRTHSERKCRLAPNLGPRIKTCQRPNVEGRCHAVSTLLVRRTQPGTDPGAGAAIPTA